MAVYNYKMCGENLNINVDADLTKCDCCGAFTKRGCIYLSDNDFLSADAYFEKALDVNPQDSRAYLGKFLIEIGKTSVDDIDDMILNPDSFKNLERAIRFAQLSDKPMLENIRNKMYKKYYSKRLADDLKKVKKKKLVDEIHTSIKNYAGSGTVDGYEKIITLISKTIVMGIYTNEDLVSAKIQADIFRFLYNYQNISTVSGIKKSKYFSGTAITETTISNELKKMIAHGSVEAIKTSTNVYYGVKSVTKKLLEEKYGKAYNSALNTMKDAISKKDAESLRFAASSFASLGNYSDSSAKSSECKNLAMKFEAEKSNAGQPGLKVQVRPHINEQTQNVSLLPVSSQSQTQIKPQESAQPQAPVQPQTPAQPQAPAQPQTPAQSKAPDEPKKPLTEEELFKQNQLIAEGKVRKLKHQLRIQEDIYNDNKRKLFGKGVKLRADAEAEMERLRKEINQLEVHYKLI